MKSALLLTVAITLALTCHLPVAAQEPPAEDKTTIFFLAGRMGIEVTTESTRDLPRDFVRNYAEKASTYRLYEIESPDPDKPCPHERCVYEWVDFLDAKRPPKCVDSDCQTIQLYFKAEIPGGKNFILTAANFKPKGAQGKFNFASDPTAEITGPLNAFDQGKEFRVKSNTLLKSLPEVDVNRTVYRVKRPDPSPAEPKPEIQAIKIIDTLKAVPTEESPAPSTTLSLKLEKQLAGGNEYDLTIPKGITDTAGKVIEAKGKLKTEGAAAAPAESTISGTFSFDTSVHQKAVFDLSGTFTPLRNPNTGSWYWEPRLTVDVGLRSTKSQNSITFSVLATRYIEVDESSFVSKDKSNISTYAGWRKTPWHRLGSTKFYIGPKAEFDRTFKRINALGEIRFDFNFYRFLGTIKGRRDLITQPPPFGIGEENGKSLEGVDFGFKLVPYVLFNFGGHVTNETVTKEVESELNGVITKNEISVLVPRHKILRGYIGFTGEFEWRGFIRPVKLILDEAIFYNATNEIIGYTTDFGAFIRRVHGLHPHFKTSLDFELDRNKHYSLSFVYENGRAAPNFEYLNKFTGGIKVTY